MDLSLLEKVPELVHRIRATPPFDVEFVSEELASLTGYSVGQFIGPDPEVRWTDLVHPDDVPRAYEVIQRALAGERPSWRPATRPAEGSRATCTTGLADRVEADGGSLKLLSEPGRGTTVTAELPVA